MLALPPHIDYNAIKSFIEDSIANWRKSDNIENNGRTIKILNWDETHERILQEELKKYIDSL